MILCMGPPLRTLSTVRCRRWAGDGLTSAGDGLTSAGEVAVDHARRVTVDVLMGLRGLVDRVAHADTENLIAGLGVAGTMRVIVVDMAGLNGLLGGMVHVEVRGNLATGQEGLACGRNCIDGMRVLKPERNVSQWQELRHR